MGTVRSTEGVDEIDELIVRVDAAPGGSRRSADAREAIVRAATELFLAHGYQAAGTDRIAAVAGVSKQTVYNQFGDKEKLFAAVVLGVTATAEAFADEVAATLGAVGRPEEVDPALRELSRRWVRAVLSPRVLAVRRLVIGEAGRFPELAARYHHRAPAATLRVLATALAGLVERGLLDLDDPERTATDLAFVLFGAELDRGMFDPAAAGPDDATVEALVDHALRLVMPPSG